jgi:putative DNA primase/helicase
MAAPPTTTAADKAAMIAAACQQATATSTGWQACCPAHDDSNPSLSIGYTDDKVLLCCFAGCTFDAICAALMLKPAELFCGERWGNSPITDVYDYVDEHGTLLFQVCRTLDKKFPQRRPDGQWKIPGVRRVLYHLPEVLGAIARGEPIYITEGEKDADNVRALGLTATCNPMGASKKPGKKWLDSYTKSLHGADCYLLPDHDEEGAAHMQAVAFRLYGQAASVRIVPGIHTAAHKSDVSNWLAAGHTRAELEAAAAATPLWTPQPITFHAAAPPSTNGSHPPTDPPVPPTGRQFDPDNLYTDSYNARAFADAYWLNVRYCYEWKAWFTWTGTHWQRDTSGMVMRLAKAAVKSLSRLLPAMDDKQAFALLSHIKSSLSTARLKALLESAQSEEGMAIHPDAFDRNIWLLNCANGTIDLRTGILRDAARDDYLTKCLSVKYNKQATCPTWEAFLNRVMGKKQGLVAFLHRAIGYSLTGSTMEQCLFILHGPTKTGKSTFLSRLRALLGPYGTAAEMESFMHKEGTEIRNDLADLAGARVVCAVEAQEGRRLNENLIKQLTGGVDQVKARFLFQEYFTYTPQYKVFIGTNHKPVIKDNDQAIWERIRLVPFVVQIPKDDRKKDFDATLHKEIEGILAWAVQGCLDWQRDGKLGEPPEVVAATEGYQKEMDIIGRFLEEKCQVELNEKLQAKELYDAYKAWCDENGERWDTQTTFGKKMVERGIEKKPGHVVMYQDITWKKPPEKPAEAPSEDADVPF